VKIQKQRLNKRLFGNEFRDSINMHALLEMCRYINIYSKLIKRKETDSKKNLIYHNYCRLLVLKFHMNIENKS
jgi:hypothetical protein